MFDSYFKESIIGRAIRDKKIKISFTLGECGENKISCREK